MPVAKLRPMDAFKTKMDGKEFICLKDVEGIVDEIVALSPEAFFVAAHLDGRSEIVDIQAQFAKYFNGQIIYSDDITSLTEDLDKRGLLFTKNYEERKQKIDSDFKSSPVRPAHLRDKSYPADKQGLSEMINSFFDSDKGPSARPSKEKSRDLRACIAPHIDYMRGGFSYAHVYKQIAETKPKRTFIILGVAHSSPPTPFTITEKDFETPNGNAPVNREITGKLVSEFNDSTKYEIVHRTEHSIELEVTFLKAVLDYDFNIVPILCSSISRTDEPAVKDFIARLSEFIDSDTLIISGADLAHVGPRFGDPYQVTERLIEWMSQEDHKSIEHIKSCDADGFFDSVMYDGNRRKVCGLSSIYTTLKLLKSGKGELLNYAYAPDPSGGIVSFASIVF